MPISRRQYTQCGCFVKCSARSFCHAYPYPRAALLVLPARHEPGVMVVTRAPAICCMRGLRVTSFRVILRYKLLFTLH